MKKILLQNVRENESTNDFPKNPLENSDIAKYFINESLASTISQNTFLNTNFISGNKVENTGATPLKQNGIPFILMQPNGVKNKLNMVEDKSDSGDSNNSVNQIKISDSQLKELDIQITNKQNRFNSKRTGSMFGSQTKKDYSFLKSSFDPLLTQGTKEKTPKLLQLPIAVKESTTTASHRDNQRNSVELNYQYQKSVIRCLICGKLFNNSSALAKHKLTHSDERKYTCNICSKAFKRQDHLNGHLMTHCSKKPFECKFSGCGKSYCDARSLKRHLENHHQDITLNSTTNQTAVVSASYIVESRGNDEAKLLQKTDQSASPKLIWSTGCNPLDEPKPVKCHICDRGFKNLPALNGHMRLHGGYVRRDSDDDAYNEKVGKVTHMKQQCTKREECAHVLSNENSNMSAKSSGHHSDDYSALFINNNDQYYVNYMQSDYKKIATNSVATNASAAAMGDRYHMEQYYSKNMSISLDGIKINGHNKSNDLNRPPLILHTDNHFDFGSRPYYEGPKDSKYINKIIHSSNLMPANYKETSIDYSLLNNMLNPVSASQLLTEVNWRLKIEYDHNMCPANGESFIQNTNKNLDFDVKECKDAGNILDNNLLHRRRALRNGITSSNLSRSLNINDLSDTYNSLDSSDIYQPYSDKFYESIRDPPELSSPPFIVTKAALKYHKISTPLSPRSPQTASEPDTPAQCIKFLFPPRQDQAETEPVVEVVEASLPEGANVDFLVCNSADNIKETQSQVQTVHVTTHSNKSLTENKGNLSSVEPCTATGVEIVALKEDVAKENLFLAPGPAARIKKKKVPTATLR